MNHHERESFIYILRSGKVKLYNNIFIIPPTIDIASESYEKYFEIYNECLNDDIMTEESMNIWMKENGIWTKYNENMVEKLKKDIEDLKVDLYNSRLDKKKCKSIKDRLRHNEAKLFQQNELKNSEYQNTCEGIAHNYRINWLISKTTFQGKKLYNFHKESLQKAIYSWHNAILNESQCRELCRNDPWRSLWSMNKNIKIKLFMNKKNQDLTINQKNIVIWSQIYDNSYESMDSPDSSVYEDDDMFDGWMIVQKRKNEKQKTEQQTEELIKNPKIKNSSEVYVMASDSDHAKSIYDINGDYSKHIIHNRFKSIDKHQSLSQSELPDEKERIQILINQKRSKS